MLQQLSIDNYILIPHLEIDFSKGFSCISGETGAGKSILVGALSLLMGQRADTSVLREQTRKCVIEATFEIGTYNLETLFEKYELDFDKNSVFRREINQQGKSRAFINDTPVNLSVMKELGSRLLDIHSQHQTLELNNSAFQTAIIDAFAQNSELLNNYTLVYKRVNALKKELNDKIDREKQADAEREYMQFQFDELEVAKLMENEQAEYEEELDTLTHTEDIKSKTFAALQLLLESENNIIGALNETHQLIENASKHSVALNDLKSRLHEAAIELKDIASDLQIHNNNLSYDKDRINFLTLRLDLIYKLELKHRVTSVVELLDLQNQLRSRLEGLNSLEDEIQNLKKNISAGENELFEISNVLSGKRSAVVHTIETQMLGLLSSLGMPSARFVVKIEKLEQFSPTGIDKVVFLFSANKGIEPKEIQEIASGGEISRLMLSIKSLVLNQSLLPTILFDEIDTGVSGDIAGKVGSILRSMSQRLQVIAITHLPQIASKANVHFLAYKTDSADTTISNLKLLSSEERVMEIARMLSDEQVTESAKITAKELLNYKN